MIIALIVILVLIILIVVWFIGTQRKLVLLDENCSNALAQIDVNLTSRFDALTGLLDLVKGYNEHEYKTLTDTIAMRKTGHTLADIQANDNLLASTSAKLIATAEAYPELKSNSNYTNLMATLKEYEDKVRTSRMVYNDSVTKLNRETKMFPTCLIAGMFRISRSAYLAADEKHEQMPSMK